MRGTVTFKPAFLSSTFPWFSIVTSPRDFNLVYCNVFSNLSAWLFSSNPVESAPFFFECKNAFNHSAYIFKTRKNFKNKKIRSAIYGWGGTPGIRLDFVKTLKNTDNLVTIQNDKNVFYIEQKRFLTNSNYIFDIDVSADEAKLLQKTYAIPHNTLFQNAEWALGIVTGDNKKHLSDVNLQNLEPVFRGADIEAFV